MFGTQCVFTKKRLKIMLDDEKFEQARRVLFLMNEFLAGKKYSTKEIHRLYENKYKSCSMKTVQRDIRVIYEETSILESERIGLIKYWSIPRDLLKGYPVKFHSDELLSLHLIKAFLRTFSDSDLADNINGLIKKIDMKLSAPIIMNHSFVWEHTPGKYDYSSHKGIITQLIRYIIDKVWLEIDYQRMSDDCITIISILPVSFYEYQGNLYLIAYFIKRKSYLTFAVQNIKEIRISSTQHSEIPVFDNKVFKEQVFAVFADDLHDIKLRIAKTYTKYFENRLWHPSQKISKNPDGSMILEMKVPIAPDLISWILSWHQAITVIEPQILKDRVVSYLKDALNNY
jgi:predicted DNA-binding transcriptional regulator YafY